MTWFAIDAIAVASYLSVAIVFMLVGYKLAGDSWWELHPINIPAFGKRPGYWAEIPIIISVSGLIVLINWLTPKASIIATIGQGQTPEVSIVATIQEGPIATAGIVLIILLASFILSAVVIRIHDRTVEKPHEKKDLFIKRLRRGYAVYNFYSTMLFSVGPIVVALIVMQYLRDGEIFARSRLETFAILRTASRQPGGPPDLIQASVENAYGVIVLASNQIGSQMTPIFLFAAFLLLVNTVVSMTPVRKVFVFITIPVTQYASIGAVVFVLIVAFFTYFGTYSEFIDQSLNLVRELKPSLVGDNWELLQRYNEVLVDLERRRSLVGFLAFVGSESGLAVVFAGGLQWTLSIAHSKREDRAKQSGA